MCGIVGWVDAGGVDRDLLTRARERLGARGPDGRGEWTGADGRVGFGHCRLAILDTSDRGRQPSLAPDGLSAFLHNGEIYNFRELRRGLEAEGERFVSESDAEVAHRVLRREGAAGIGRLEGMFALAMWEEHGERLLLARDRIGIKPLFYAILPRGLAFASQPSALLELPGVAARLDPAALSDFLAYGYVPFDRCLFAGIRKLPAGHTLRYELASGRLDVAPYWRLERRDVRDDPSELRERIDRAVATHLVSDVAVGAFLSGGLDSTVVAARASAAQPLPTFTVAYRDGDLDDVRFARLAARVPGAAHPRELLDLGDLGSALDRAALVFDEPLYDSRALAMLELSRLTRATVKVSLSGDGGDEVFGGYGWHESVLRYEALRRRLDGFAPVLRAAGRAAERLARTSAGRRAAGTARVLGEEFADRYFAVRGFFGAAEQERL